MKGGGTALAVALVALALAPGAQALQFEPGPSGLSVAATKEDGSPATLSGSHPYRLETKVQFAPGPEAPGEPGVPFTAGDIRLLELEMPSGLIENPSAVRQCTADEFHAPRDSPFEESRSGESCPDRSQIGTVEVRSSFAGGSTRTFGLFNLVPPPGVPSAIGFNPYGGGVVFVPRLRQADGDYGITWKAEDIPQVVNLNGFTFDVWGDPWAISHNFQRGNCLKETEPSFGWGKCSVGWGAQNPAPPYLTLPTSCEGPTAFAARAESWQQPGATITTTYSGPELEGCGGLDFAPVALGRFSDLRASSPSGFQFDLNADQTGLLTDAFRSASPVRNAIVRLPDGVTINPSVGAGLGICTPGQYEGESASPGSAAGCPDTSKIGDFSVASPLFEKRIEGSIYLAAPYDNPFGTLIGLYLVAKSTERGVLIKVSGKLDADRASGNLVATFENLPQLPYTDLRIRFREGQRSPLATPRSCGTFATGFTLAAWRSGDVVTNTSPFPVEAGVGGGPCPEQPNPFAPGAAAGSLNAAAGAYSPFYLHLTRKDDEQEITSYSATLPRGLTGKLAGVPYCPDAAIEAAKRRSGVEEAAHPSCPAASSIGHTVSGFGLGPVLSYAPGGLYLAGPFNGSPFSIVAIDSATVGPFDLGVIVVRSAIRVDPLTAQVSIDSAGSDPIPHIVRGIPIHLADIRVYIDRPEFTHNPTSCEPFATTSVLSGSGNDFAASGDDVRASVPSRYQAFDCVSLGFRPRLKLRLKGGTRRGVYPSLHAEVIPRPGDANIASAAVTLPASEFLAQNHIGEVCTRGQFAREACPAGSVYGRAKVFTELLGQPLEGKVYLRSSEHELPDLVAALRGGGNDLAIDVVGRIDSVHGGLRGTFDTIPDAPFTRFTMTLFGGKRGLLVNAENLCRSKQRASARMIGHNNLGRRWKPKVATPCSHAKRKAKEKQGRGGR